MVFLSIINYVRSRGPDEFWRKRKIFKLAAHFRGRRRNVYSIAIRNVHRALAYATKGRKLKKLDMKELWTQRVEAGSLQYDMPFETFRQQLIANNILLNRKVLADLSIWEPKSFEALVKIAQDRCAVQGIPIIKENSPMRQIYGIKKRK